MNHEVLPFLFRLCRGERYLSAGSQFRHCYEVGGGWFSSVSCFFVLLQRQGYDKGGAVTRAAFDINETMMLVDYHIMGDGQTLA